MLTTNFVATQLLLDVIPSLLDGSLYSPLQPKTCETSHIHLHALYVVSEDNLQITPISKLWPVADLTLYMWSTCSLTVPAHPPSLCTAGKT